MKMHEIKDAETLLNMPVLVKTRYHESLSKITKVLKTGVRVESSPNDIYSFNGYRKGGDSWSPAWIEPLTEKERLEWLESTRKEKVRQSIISIIKNDIVKCSYEKLLELKETFDKP